MFKKFLSVAIGLFAFGFAFPVQAERTWFPTSGNTDAYYHTQSVWGTHEWDKNYRTRNYKLRRHKPPLHVILYSPKRARSYALHPVYRHDYYAPAFPLNWRYTARTLEPYTSEGDTAYGCPYGYNYQEPNYRTPPFDFNC